MILERSNAFRIKIWKEWTMFTQKLLSNRHLLWVLSFAMMFALILDVSSMTAENSSSATITQAIVAVSNLDFACTPPSPITQDIQLSGDFVIQAYIATPPSPVLPPSPIITLHLDATGISGVGVTDGLLYRGQQGPSQNFQQGPSPFVFDTTFDLVPAQSNELPPRPICPVQVSFQVQVYATEVGFYVVSASLNPPV
jgi:hypothetical protein